ncbi:hypothetical protein L6452_32237 [Arctium lappa]|uniref:Uncharacterized protein n=1 Tax=Arctium lappa TaxID=4217 RepID=A0ACB8Z352_ARCLA|nr:hypothetical protein L6452_32237 [Arctium lappa]
MLQNPRDGHIEDESTADQPPLVTTTERPHVTDVLGGGPEQVPRVNLDTGQPIVEEDRDASHRRTEAMAENAVNGSGGEPTIVGTKEHAIRDEKKKDGGCSFKTFLCSRAPEFSGTTDPLACMKWIQDVEMAFESSECTNSQRVKFGSQLLRGDALSWWNITRRDITLEVLAQITWPIFKKKLMQKYCNERALDKIEDEFRNLKKGNLSVADYAK